MISKFRGSFLTPSLHLVQILITDPLLVESEFHEPPPSPLDLDIIYGYSQSKLSRFVWAIISRLQGSLLLD